MWYGATRYDTDEVMDDLVAAGCKGNALRRCSYAMWEGRPNQGLTYSNGERRVSVMVIGWSTSREQYANTISHETGHVAVHIADELGVDKSRELFCYIIGEVTQKMWKDAHRLTCERCGCKEEG